MLKHKRPHTWDANIEQEVRGGCYGPIDFKGKVVMDIGAHIGSFSNMALEGGAKFVMAVEAHPRNFKVLLQNMEEFPKEKWQAWNVAAWNGEEYHVTIGSGAGANTGGNGVYADRPEFIVPSMKYHHIAKALEDVLHPDEMFIDILKMDCEGGEWAVLFDLYAEPWLKHIPLIVGELHSSMNWKTHRGSPDAPNSHPDTFDAQLKKLGFEVSWRGSGSPYLNNFTAVNKNVNRD